MPGPTASLSDECVALVRQFCIFADEADAPSLAALFTADAVFERGELRVEGREALEKMVRSRAADVVTRHLLTTSFVTPADDKQANGRHYCLVYASGAGHDPSKPIVREYRDDYRLTDEGWRIAHRIVLTPFGS